MTSLAIPPGPFHVPASVWRDTLAPIRDAGRRGYECFVLWLGAVENGQLRVSDAIVPKQISKHVDEGCYVRVEGDELFRLSVIAHERGLLICGQVHAHPLDAYHSEVDENRPLVALPGALSVVLPRFATPPLTVNNWAIFRLNGTGDWSEIESSDALTVESNGLS